MSDTGWKSSGTVVSDDTVGTVAWSNPDNAKVSDDSYSSVQIYGYSPASLEAVKIVKSNGSIGTENKTTEDPLTDTEKSLSFGDTDDLWSETWAHTDINDSDFGVVIQSTDGDHLISVGYSHYLKATNFGFTIPSGATIDGIVVEVEAYNFLEEWESHNYYAYVDHIRIKVYYTESTGTDANSERSLYLQGESSSNSERGLYLQGKLTNNSERGLYFEGYVSDLYTRESASDLESDDANLTTTFSEQEYTDVATDDDDFVDLEGNGVYQKFLFKEYNEDNNNTDNFVITWKGKTTLAPSDSSVYLQIYNRDTPSWETIDTESSANANTEFTLSGVKTTSLSDYYDESYVVDCRVYQEAT